MNSDAKLMQTKCGKCLGCSKLEDKNFRGDSKCARYVQDETKKSEVKHSENITYRF